MYDNASYGELMAQVHLFGIKHGNIIQLTGYKSTEIVKASGIKHSYAVEVSNGVKLSKYVVPK